MRFTRRILSEVWNPVGPGQMNTMLAAADFNGDGHVDIAVSGRFGYMAWLENPGGGEATGNWKRHFLDKADGMECGGTAFPVRGETGFADLINGSESSGDAIFWWANPGTKGPWQKHLVARTGFRQIHDTFVGEVGGRNRLFFTNQLGAGGGRLWSVPIPGDPFVSPWPDLELVAEELWDPNPYNPDWVPNQRQPVEGIAVGDVDGDGENEVVCGTHWIKWEKAGHWKVHRFAEDYVTTKVLIADVDGDGRNEIILSEGDAVLARYPRFCKCAWFKPRSAADLTGRWSENLIMDGLQDAHTLKAGPITGPGKTDLVLGEIGKADWQTGNYIGQAPRLWVMENKGGRFEPHLIDEGTGVHDSALLDLRNSGKMDIVIKPLHGPDKWNIIALFQD